MAIEREHDFEERLMGAEVTPEDDGELSLRPKHLREYIGQKKAKSNLEVFIEAANTRCESLDHVLHYGSP